MLTHEQLASHPWLSIFGPVGAGVYQCLLWAAMPITELCTRGWKNWDPVTFCQDGCFFGRSAGEWGRTQRGVNARHWPCGTCLQMVARLMQTGVPFRSDPVLRDIVVVCHDAMEKLSRGKTCSGIKKASKSCEDWRKTQIWIHLGGDLGLGRWLNIIFFLLPVPRFLTSYSKLHGDSASAAVRDDKDDLLGPASCLGLAGVYLGGWKLLVVMIPIKHMVLIFNLQVITCYAES